MSTKIAIGCLVQWYEYEILSEYLKSLRDAIDYSSLDINVDLLLCINQDLEKIIDTRHIESIVFHCQDSCSKYNFNLRVTDELVTIADYRRLFNEKYCEIVDLIMWGETDMLVPKQTFSILDSLHNQISEKHPKYLCTFSTCKMWDESWRNLEHSSFTDFNHSDSDKDWWSVNYTMSINEMNNINSVEYPNITSVPHKFNGCGLVISSDVIKSGVNIPRSVFFVHEDTAFMLMVRRLLPDIPQFHVSNILLVHNRKHKSKRLLVKEETGVTIREKRNSNKWYSLANKFSEQNAYNLFNPHYTFKSWKDVWNQIL